MSDPSSSAQSVCRLTLRDNWLPWLERISALKQDMSRGAAPHKPLLLLVVLDLIEDGKLDSGLVRRDGNLAFRFTSYWTIVAERRTARPDVRLPFYHMKSDGFWTPLDASGSPAPSRESATLGQLDPDFLRCAMEADFRMLARRSLIAKYFEPNERATLYSLVGIERPAGDMITVEAERFKSVLELEPKRDARFALRVLPAYDYTCALTRYRMVAVDGKTAVDAAHIHQFKKGGPSSPRNGIALSKTAHWLFDRGFWSIAGDFRVIVKAESFDEAGEVSQLLKPRVNKPILLPAKQSLWPGQEFLAWHRRRHGFCG